jgi:tetratricopeptide (TPR) repeat protein
MLVKLCRVSGRLGRTLTEEYRWDEARRLYECSIEEAEDAIRSLPHVAFLREWLLSSLSHLVQIADREKNPEEAEALLTRAIAYAEEWHRDVPAVESLVALISMRRLLAQALAWEGRRDEARALVLANHRSLTESPRDGDNEGIATERVRNPLDFHRWGLGPPPDAWADAVGPPDPLALLASADGDRLPAEAWARLALRVLRSTVGSSAGTFRESRAALWFTADLRGLAAAQRRGDRLDQARRTVDRLAAFARLLVERNPSDPAAYLVLADAYEQESKNAWRPAADRPTIERTLWQAVAVNRRALDLAPYDELAHYELERRERKLDNLLHHR